MATFNWFDGNQGIYNYTDFRDFDVVRFDEARIDMEYNEGDGPFDPTQTPFEIRMFIDGGETYVLEDGENAGETVLVAGTVTTIKYFDEDGNLLLQIDDLEVSASAISAWLIDDQPFPIDEYIWAGGHTFVGSNDSSGPENDWDGDDIATGGGHDTVFGNGGDDYVKDKGGKDIYDLGDGYDTVTYDEWYWNPAGIQNTLLVNLSRGFAKGPDGKRDELISVESVRGTFLDDRFIGDDNDNRFYGFLGKDDFNGKGGFNTVDYSRDDRQGGTDGIYADLNDRTVRDGFGTVDTLQNIQGVIGTDRKDFFVSDKKDNWFRGQDGADQFIFYSTDFGHDSIDDFSRSDGDKIRIKAADNFSDLSIDYDDVSGHAFITFSTSTIEVQDWVRNNPGVALEESDFIF